ncbi:hypothetical protein AYO42_00850 [Rhizomicrobium sp. SCGC AG-212-E05]|nr:hypothetical protein AYO42_00850 [Rhizomicrobium sp. SCGC AG-212-E05]
MADQSALKRVASALDEKIKQCRAHLRQMELHGYYLVAHKDPDYDSAFTDECQYMGYLLEEARIATLLLLEVGQLPLMHREFRLGIKQFDLSSVSQIPDEPDDLHSEALTYTDRIVEAAKLAIGIVDEETNLVVVVERLLWQTPHLLHAFGIKPTREAEVHKALLDILCATFPDTIDRPDIPQIGKVYQPDIGIKSLRVAIEVKYSDDKTDVKNHIDQIYADMHGYSGNDAWTKFYALIFTPEPILFTERIVANWKSTNADLRWTPIVVHGLGGKPTQKNKRQTKTPALLPSSPGSAPK